MNFSNSHASHAEQILALAGLLVDYTGLTREAYALDLRLYDSWRQEYHIGLFQTRRADIECFTRDLEARGRAGRASPAACAPPPGSTGAPSKNSSITPGPPSPPASGQVPTRHDGVLWAYSPSGPHVQTSSPIGRSVLR
jgi:hypothetical protein